MKNLLVGIIALAPIEAFAEDKSWTGPSFGVELGAYQFEDVIVESDVWQLALDFNSTSAGFRAGYDYDFGKVVIGAVASYTFGNGSSEGLQEFEGEPDSEFLMGVDIGARSAIALRAGIPYGDILPYITAGISKTNVAHQIYHSDSSTEFVEYESNQTGKMIGVGVDFRSGNGWIYGIELSKETRESVFMKTDPEVEGYGGDQDADLTSTGISFHIMKTF